MKKISRLKLLRLKSKFKTSSSAWKDIASRLKIKPAQVTAKHSTKAWIWLPKNNSGFVLLRPGETKSGKIIKNKSKSKNKSKKKTVRVTTSRKDFDMCKNIDNALKNPNVSEIIIKK